IRQGHVLEFATDHRLAREVRGGLLHPCAHSILLLKVGIVPRVLTLKRRGPGGNPGTGLATYADSRASGIGTTLARTYSPRLLACGSLRSDAATPSPSNPFSTKLTARRFGRSCRSTSSARASGRSARNRSTVRKLVSQAYAAGVRTQRPTLG